MPSNPPACGVVDTIDGAVFLIWARGALLGIPHVNEKIGARA